MAMTGTLGGMEAANVGFQQGNAARNAMYATDTPPAVNGLARIADQVTEAAARIDQIALMLGQVSYGIHGPRPEPVSNQGKIEGPSSDSLASRVHQLLETVDRLQRACESVIR